LKRNSLNVSILFFIIIYSIQFSCFSILNENKYFEITVSDNKSLLNIQSLLFLPCDEDSLNYKSNKYSFLENELNDSFYFDAVNRLIYYEISKKRFNVVSVASILPEDKKELIGIFSDLNKKNNSELERNLSVGTIIQKYNCQGIVIPVICSLGQSVSQNQGWRNGKYGGTYERPVEIISKAKIRIQIRGSSGKVIYDVVASGRSKKPLLYSVLNKINKNKDVIGLARSIYGPPLLKAINNSIKGGLSF
jgi:hypothetical protein